MDKVAVGLVFAPRQLAHGTRRNATTDNLAAAARLHAVTSDSQPCFSASSRRTY